MPHNSHRNKCLDRRSFLKRSAMAAGALAVGPTLSGASTSHDSLNTLTALTGKKENKINQPTRFIHACMTLPYRNFPLERALTGIKSAGFDYVAWGIQHREEDGENHLVMPPDAHPDRAAELGRRCRDHGLEPVKMFSRVYPDDDDAIEVLTQRIRQAAAAGLEYVLTFGRIEGGDPRLWIERFKQLGPIAADHNVTVVMKQHGGQTTGTGKALSSIVIEVGHPNIQMSYDAGNVYWYLEVDPIPDIKTSTEFIHTFCLKDARGRPDRTICGPGYGEIDHYLLFAPVAFTGRTITLAYENIYPPYIGQPTSPEQIDRWARVSKEYMENVINGIQRT